MRLSLWLAAVAADPLKAAMLFLTKRLIVATEAIEHSTAALVLLGKGSKRTADEMLEVLPIKYLRLSLIAAENLSSVGRYLRITQFPPFFLFML